MTTWRLSTALHRLAYAAICLALIGGILMSELQFRQVLKEAWPYFGLAGGLIAVGLLARWRGLSPAHALIASFALLTVQFISLSSIVAAVVFFFSAALVGSRLLRPLGYQSTLVSMLAGVFLLTGIVGWLLPFHVHLRAIYVPVFAGIVWLDRTHVKSLCLAGRDGLNSAISAAPATASFAILISCISLTTVWLPTIQFDDLAYHSMLPAQLLKLGYYRFDASTQVWALAPWGADLVHAIVGVIANEESRSAVNLLWFLFSSCAMWALGKLLGLTPRWRWLAIGLFASQPYISGLLGGSQVENELVGATLVLGIVAVRLMRDNDTNAAYIAFLFCGLFASLKASQAIVVLPLILLAFPQMIHAGRLKLAWFLCVGILLGLSSYFYSSFLTGSPLLPLVNGIFKSSYFPASDFRDLRWTQGLSWRSAWDLTFATQFYQENYVGGAGFSMLVLSVPLLGALCFKPLRAVVAWVIVSTLLMFWTIQYLRYIAPLLVLMIPFALCVVQVHAIRIATVATVVALTIANVALIPATSYMLKNGPVQLQLSSLLTTGPVVANRAIVEQYAFESNLERYLAAVEPGKYGLYLADKDRPYTSPFAGQAFAANWYDFAMQAAATNAERDATGQRWIKLFSQTGIKYVLAKNDLSEQPALAAALRADATKTLAFQSHALYCFCQPGFFNLALPLYQARDLSRWLRPTLRGSDDLPRSPKRVVPGQNLLDDRPTTPAPLTLTPHVTAACGSAEPEILTLSWDASAISHGGITIAVALPGRRWKTLLRGPIVGSAKTGISVPPGTTFSLIADKRVIDRVTYDWHPCVRPLP
jgi:hypothetical protein